MAVQRKHHPRVIALVVGISFLSHVITTEVESTIDIWLILVAEWRSPSREEVGVVHTVDVFRSCHHVGGGVYCFIIKVRKLVIPLKNKAQLLKHQLVSEEDRGRF